MLTKPRRAMAKKKPADKPADAKDDPIGEKLRRLIVRKAKGREDQEIASAAGMTSSKLSQLLNGHIPDPRWSTVTRLLEAIGATLCDLEKS